MRKKIRIWPSVLVILHSPSTQPRSILCAVLCPRTPGNDLPVALWHQQDSANPGGSWRVEEQGHQHPHHTQIALTKPWKHCSSLVSAAVRW